MRPQTLLLTILGLAAAALWLGTNPLAEFQDGTGSPKAFPQVLGEWQFAGVESTFPAAARASGGASQAVSTGLDGSRLHLDAGMIRWTSRTTRTVAGPVTYRSFPDRSTSIALPGGLMQALGATSATDPVQGTLQIDATGALILVQGGMRYRWTRPGP